MKAKKYILPIVAMIGFSSSIFSGIVSNKSFIFEKRTGGVYCGEVEEEYRDLYFHKFKSPSDPKYTTQKNYSMSNVGDIESVWDNYTGKGTTIAVIDDGFDIDHPEYKDSNGNSVILSTSRYYYESGSSYGYKSYSSDSSCIKEDWEEDDTYGDAWATHGTNTSTTAAAPMQGVGGVGIAPGAKILALKIDFSFASIKGAITYAISQKVDVINMSLGAYAASFTDGFGDSQSGSSYVATALESVCKQAYEAGIIVVAAAGNEATSYKSYPACNYKVIGVGALEEGVNDTLAAFTNYNQSETQADEKNVDILAPGYVYTATQDGTKSSITHTYSDTQGTSFSSPIVAGAACLWKEKNPNGTPDEFYTALTTTASDIGKFKDATIPLHLYQGYDTSDDIKDANISCGWINIGKLMDDTISLSLDKTSDNIYTVNTSNKASSTTITATISPSTLTNKKINWSSSNTSVCTVSSSSTSTATASITVTAVGAGTSTITATLDDTTNGTISETCTITVSNWISVSSINLKDANGGSSSTILKGNTIQLTTTILPTNASDKTYIIESNNINVATVSTTGLVTAKGVGTTSITAISTDKELEATYTITVEKNNNVGTILINLYNEDKLSDASSTTGISTNYLSNKVTVNGTTKNGVVTINSKDKAYVDKAGGLTFGSGSSTGYAEFVVSKDYELISATVIGANYDSGTIKLNNTIGKGSLNTKDTKLADCTESLEFDVTYTKDTATTLKFASSNKRQTIYTIELTYLLPTDVIITGINLTKSTINLDTVITTSASIAFTLTPTGAVSTNVSFTSNNTSIATVSSSGVVTAVSKGNTTITLSSKNSTITATCNIVVSEPTLTLSGFASSVVLGKTFDKTNIQLKCGDTVLTPTSTNYDVDTNILGEHEISASYGNLNAKGIVTVTNSGASVGESSYKETTQTPVDISVSSTGASSSNNSFNVSATSTTVETSGYARGIQWSSGNDGKVTISGFTSEHKVTSVSIVVSGNKDGNSACVKVGDTIYGTKTFNTIANTSLTFDIPTTKNITRAATATNIVIDITNGGSKSVYFKSASISYSAVEQQTFDMTPVEQAEAWATYFISETRGTNGPCLASNREDKVNGLKDIWSSLSTEYANMADVSKTCFCTNDSNSKIIEARNHYLYILSQYADDGLNAFVKDGSNVVLTNSNKTLSSLSSENSNVMIALTIVSISIVSVMFFVVKTKKKETNI